MNVPGWLVWGFAATVILTIMMSMSQILHLSRMDIPFILGTIFTPNRGRARLIGIFVHIFNGFIVALIYIAAFHNWSGPSWWKGAIIGLVHSCFLLVTMPVFPSLHPRMCDELYGPLITNQLEPPGFLALNYGIQTPVSIILSHVVFGIILGSFYRMP